MSIIGGLCNLKGLKNQNLFFTWVGDWVYSKTYVKRPLKIDKTKILMTNGSLMKVESIADEHSAMLLTCVEQ